MIGLGVMGANLALNLADSGNTVAVYNRTQSVTDEFMSGEAKTKGVLAFPSTDELLANLNSPRVVLIMVPAGPVVDKVVADLKPMLDPGDIIIDGGNSLYTDSERRHRELSEEGFRFIGMGVSGGKEGARYGPSLMPGGDRTAWPHVEAMLKGIAAIAPDGSPCCDWLGPGGAGHFVKMVHNGIEYGDMQVIAEAYDLMRRGLGKSPSEISETFSEWNSGRLQSYLIEITADILRQTEDGNPVIDVILDAAGQKGTGKWTVISSMELAEPTALVAEAVYARIVSSDPARRNRAADVFDSPVGDLDQGVDRADRSGVVRLEDHLLRARLSTVGRGIGRIRLGSRSRVGGIVVAGGMHHQGGIPRRHNGLVCG